MVSKRNLYILGSVVIVLGVWAFYSTRVNAIPEPSYTIVDSGAGYEVREYGVYSIVETRVSAPYREALNEGFQRLASYIDGDNSTGEHISMTRPILVDREDAQERNILADDMNAQETYRITFIMPEYRTLDSLPLPNDVRVVKRIVPSHKVFVKKVFCIWGCLSEKKQEKLEENAETAGFSGNNVLYARYALPWSMPFVIDNELWFIIE